MLQRYLPDEIVKKKNESEMIIELVNGSIIAIKGADNPDAIRGQDFSGVFLDEWALMKQSVWEEILRPIITQNENRWACFAFTPKGRNFVFDYWLKSDQWKDWYKSFLPVTKSKIVAEAELIKARQEMPENLYLQEFECSFLADEENTLISAQSIENLRGIRIHPTHIKKIIACDPSQGGDECIIYVFHNTEIKEMKILHLKDTMLIVGEIAAMMQRHGIKDVAIDSIGIGAGICDRLTEQGRHVIRIQSAEKPINEEKFYNKRAEMWWYVMEQIREGKVAYPEDIELRRELSFVKAKVVDSRGTIQLEPKSDTKERLRRSPDRADTFVYGLWALQHVTPFKPIDVWTGEPESYEIGSGCRSAMAA